MVWGLNPGGGEIFHTHLDAEAQTVFMDRLKGWLWFVHEKT
jgi:hypothetical protein